MPPTINPVVNVQMLWDTLPTTTNTPNQQTLNATAAQILWEQIQDHQTVSEFLNTLLGVS